MGFYMACALFSEPNMHNIWAATKCLPTTAYMLSMLRYNVVNYTIYTQMYMYTPFRHTRCWQVYKIEHKAMQSP